MPDVESRVFITHSSIDRDLAEALVRALRLGTDTRSERIFCSSVEGFGVPTGADFAEYIKRQLSATELIVPLITPAYLDSLFCMWELGAAWVREVATYPVLVEPVNYNDLPALLAVKQVVRLDRSGLNGLARKIAEQTKNFVRDELWEPERDALLQRLPDMIAGLVPEWAATNAATQRRAANCAPAAVYVHESAHALRDAAFAHSRHGGSREHTSEFLGLLRSAAVAMARALSTSSGRKCRIAIKQVVVAETNEVCVQDLTRSEGRVQHQQDLVADNTDFERILQGEEDFFFSGDLATLRAAGGYKNSHAVAGRELSYRSTIVWPIRKVIDDDFGTFAVGASDWQDLIGFLCVDAREMHAFNGADVQIGAAFADTLYTVLRPYLLPVE